MIWKSMLTRNRKFKLSLKRINNKKEIYFLLLINHNLMMIMKTKLRLKRKNLLWKLEEKMLNPNLKVMKNSLIRDKVLSLVILRVTEPNKSLLAHQDIQRYQMVRLVLYILLPLLILFSQLIQKKFTWKDLKNIRDSGMLW